MKIPAAYLFGRTADSIAWTPAKVESLGREARRRAQALRGLDPELVFSALEGAGRLFQDPRGPWRRAALAHLREHAPFSDAALAQSLDVLCGLAGNSELRRRMQLELFLPYALQCPVPRRGFDGLLSASPKGVVLHVGAGNVFLGLIDSLILGLLTRNANLVKTPSRGSQLAVLFALALRVADRDGRLARSVAVLNWPGGSADLESAALRHCDAALVWGGEESVLAYRRLAPARVHVAGFGPKLSLAVAMPSALKGEAPEAAARLMARDASLWDQSACASPHTLFLVCPDRRRWRSLLRDWVERLARAFADMQKQLPQGKLSDDEKVEITKARELAKVDSALGLAFCASAFPQPHWTVIGEVAGQFRISPQNRVLYVACAKSLDEVARRLAPYRGYVQSVGVAGTLAERVAVARRLSAVGAARVTRLGEMLSAVTGSPHDGTFPMRELVNWVGIEGRPAARDQAADLVAFARAKSPFYRRHLAGRPTVESLEDLSRLPLLTKEHILANSPPKSRGLLTGPLERGVYFASGGSTGSPKYVFYDSHEYERTARGLAAALEAGGLGRRDRIANLFVAGNLWSSWLSVEKALAFTKAVSIPVGSSLPMESVLAYLREFQVTAVIGLPSFLLKLAEAAARETRPGFPLRRIFYGGEYVGEAMVRRFRKVFPGVLVRSAAYATVDAGVVGFQCERVCGSVHHLFDQEQILEVLDPETLEPAAPGRVGELAVTCLGKRLMPIIRFRVGDLGRFLPGPCPCGRPEPRFEILGRCDDRVHAGGAHIFISDVAEAVCRVPGLSHAFQLRVGRKDRGVGDRLTLQVEARRPAPGLVARLQQSLRRRCQDLAASVDAGWLEEPSIELVPMDSLPRLARTGKIQRVVDERTL